MVSTDTYNKSCPDVVLAVITTQIDSANLPTDYLLKDWRIEGLRKESAFRAYFGTYEQNTFFRVVGKLSDTDWVEVQNRLRLAIAVSE